MSAYRISQKAHEDLDEIWIYTFRNWSVEQADRYHNLIMDEIRYVSDPDGHHEERGRKMDRIKPGYRSSKVKSHVIFYRKAGDGVTEIIRILHQQMDVEDRLK